MHQGLLRQHGGRWEGRHPPALLTHKYSGASKEKRVGVTPVSAEAHLPRVLLGQPSWAPCWHPASGVLKLKSFPHRRRLSNTGGGSEVMTDTPVWQVLSILFPIPDSFGLCRPWTSWNMLSTIWHWALKKKNSVGLNLWTSKTYSTWKSRWMPAVQSRHSESPLYYTGWRYQDDIDGGSS